jgi:hypothetical protein
MAERISTTGTSMAAAVVPGAGATTRRSRRNRWGNPVGYLFIGPGVLLYLVFSVYPILRGIVMAFQNYRFLRPASRNPFNSFNGLDNWIEMWNDPMFWHSLRVPGRLRLAPCQPISCWVLPAQYSSPAFPIRALRRQLA